MKSKKFKLIKIEPGEVRTQKFGVIDFRKDVAESILKELHSDGFPYLELTEEGEKKVNKK